MNFYTTISPKLKVFFDDELENYQFHYKKDNFLEAWNHLERAHILGQKYPFEHSFVHWKMLQFGFKIKNIKEILGQIPRLIFGGIKSFVGKIPVGNPGGVNVPPLKPFPIEEDLKIIFKKAGVTI